MSGADLTLVNLAGDPVTGEKVLPLGALAIASSLEAGGWQVELRDLQLLGQPGTVEDLAAACATDAPVLGLSLMSDRMPEAVMALRLFRERHPDTAIILGGAGPTEVALPLMQAFDDIDAVVRGEGEVTACEVMAALRDKGRAGLRDIPGVTARLNGEVVVGPERRRIAQLDALPWPRGYDWDPALYDSVSLVTARGCPFHCSFCSVVAGWGRTVGRHGIDHVVDTIGWLLARKPGAFVHLEDDTFTLDRRRVLRFCDTLQARLPGAAVQWGCTARLDGLDEALVARMAEAGCQSMFLGIESGSDRVRARVHKSFSSAEVIRRMEMLLRHVQVTAHYIWGYPFETMDDLQETFLQIGYLSAMGATARHSHLVPFPKSPLVQDATEELRFYEGYPFPRLFVVEPGAPWLDLVRGHSDVFTPWFALATPDDAARFDFVARYSRFERAN